MTGNPAVATLSAPPPARVRHDSPKLLVSEVFGPTIQGEGPAVGLPTVFVRLGGCSYRCSWCDSLHAVLPQHRHEWESMDAERVMELVQSLSPAPILVTLSGGDPAQQDCGPLIALGHGMDYKFCVESQGAIAAPWLKDADMVVLSPKPPSSRQRIRWDRFRECLEAAGVTRAWADFTVFVKVPIFDRADLEWVQAELMPRIEGLPLFLSVGNGHPPADSAADDDWPRGVYDQDLLSLRSYLLDRWRWLAEEVLERGIQARVLPQLHVLGYGNERGR